MTDTNTTPGVDDAFWQIPLTPIEDREPTPEPTYTGFTEGPSLPGPAFTPPAPPTLATLPVPKAQGPVDRRRRSRGDHPGPGVAHRYRCRLQRHHRRRRRYLSRGDDAVRCERLQHPRPRHRSGRRSRDTTHDPAAATTSSPMVRWVQAHPEVTDVLTDAQTASEKFVAKGENSDIVGAMVVCATYAPKMEAAQRASAATDPDAPAAYVSWLRHQVGAFDACIDADFTGMATQLELGTDDLSDLSDLMDDAAASLGL